MYCLFLFLLGFTIDALGHLARLEDPSYLQLDSKYRSKKKKKNERMYLAFFLVIQ